MSDIKYENKIKKCGDFCDYYEDGECIYCGTDPRECPISQNNKDNMATEELIQTPEYWKEVYENECCRLGIKPNKVKFLATELDDNKLDDVMESLYYPYYLGYGEFDSRDEEKRAFKAGCRYMLSI